MFQFLNGAIGVCFSRLGIRPFALVSIPKWCDWSCKIENCIIDNYNKFQFLNGAIGVEVYFCKKLKRFQFQFLNGAIGVQNVV